MFRVASVLVIAAVLYATQAGCNRGGMTYPEAMQVYTDELAILEKLQNGRDELRQWRDDGLKKMDDDVIDYYNSVGAVADLAPRTDTSIASVKRLAGRAEEVKERAGQSKVEIQKRWKEEDDKFSVHIDKQSKIVAEAKHRADQLRP